MPKSAAFCLVVTLALGAALSAAALLRSSAQAAGRQTWVIEVSEGGFNPAVCKLSRGDTVEFKNVGTKPRRVVWDDPNGPIPFYDSGEIAPGTIAALSFTGFDFPSRWTFHDTFDTALKTIVMTPTFSNSWDPDCTPSATSPTVAPTATATPGGPGACATAIACVRVVALAADK